MNNAFYVSWLWLNSNIAYKRSGGLPLTDLLQLFTLKSEISGVGKQTLKDKLVMITDNLAIGVTVVVYTNGV